MKIYSLLRRLVDRDHTLEKLFNSYIFVQRTNDQVIGLIEISNRRTNLEHFGKTLLNIYDPYMDHNTRIYMIREELSTAMGTIINTENLFSTDVIPQDDNLSILGKIVYLSYRGYNLDMMQYKEDIDLCYILSYEKNTDCIVNTLLKTYKVNNQTFINLFFTNYTQMANTELDIYYGSIKTFDEYINFILGDAKTTNEIVKKLKDRMTLGKGFSVYLYMNAEVIVSESIARKVLDKFGFFTYETSALEWTEKIAKYLIDQNTTEFKFLDMDIDILNMDRYNHGICSRWNKFISSNDNVNVYLYGTENVVIDYDRKPKVIPVTHRWNRHHDETLGYKGKDIVIIADANLTKNTKIKTPKPKKVTLYDSIYEKIVFRYYANTVGYVLIHKQNIYKDFSIEKRKKLTKYDIPINFETQMNSLISYKTVFNEKIDSSPFKSEGNSVIENLKLESIENYCKTYYDYLSLISKNMDLFKKNSILFGKHLVHNKYYKFLKDYKYPYLATINEYVKSAKYSHIGNNKLKIKKRNILFIFNVYYNLFLIVTGDYKKRINLYIPKTEYKIIYDHIHKTKANEIKIKKVQATNVEKTSSTTSSELESKFINFSDL